MGRIQALGAGNIEALFKRAAIAYRQNLELFLESRWYEIAVFFINASTLRVGGLLPPLTKVVKSSGILGRQFFSSPDERFGRGRRVVRSPLSSFALALV